MVKRIAPYAVFALIVLAMIAARVAVGASTELAAAQQARSGGELMKAVHHYDRSIHWYLPLHPAIPASIADLTAIATDYESQGKSEDALFSWRILRSALYSARHLRQPHPEAIARADERIAHLMALQAGAPGTPEFDSEREKRFAQLTEVKGPKTAFALLAEFGFFGWVAAAFLFIAFAVKPEGGLVAKRAAMFGLIFAVCYALWMLGLAKA
jgi:hypothetical protein